MTRNTNFETLLKILPEYLFDVLQETADCLTISPRAAVRGCRSAMIYTIEALESAKGIKRPGSTWHKRINGLLEKGAVSAITANYMHTLLSVRDEVDYRGGRASFSDAEACLGMLVAVLRATFPIGRTPGSIANAA
jgi:hypothetical protein